MKNLVGKVTGKLGKQIIQYDPLNLSLVACNKLLGPMKAVRQSNYKGKQSRQPNE